MSDRVVTAERTVNAPPEVVFALLADPRQHLGIDGSGMLQDVDDASPARLALGSRFEVGVKFGARYRVSNEVVEFEDNRRIAWQVHPSGPLPRFREWLVGGHRWRYEFMPSDEGTRVKETWDWSGARSPWAIRLMGFPRRNVQSIDRTLDGLQRRFASS